MRTRQPRTDEDVTEAVCRMIRALAKRLALGDPDSLRLLELVDQELDDARAATIAGLRDVGWSDSSIGRELGVSKQAVAQRWPR
jgi:hypothetical protein